MLWKLEGKRLDLEERFVMAEEKKLALLIDSDNVSAKYAQDILKEASKYGELACKRVYGDWEKGGNGWHYPAVNNSILPVQQTCYIPGKNATDFSIIIDAMDLLYSGNIDGFVLVTSDSDFTRLAIRLREAGKLVVGIGEVKTPLAFTSSCHHFSYLNQVADMVREYDEKTIRKAVLDFVKEKDDGRLDLAKINAFITSKFGNVDYSLFGFNRLSSFIDSFSEFRRNSTFVSLKKAVKGYASAGADKSAPSEKEIVGVIKEFLERDPNREENISRVSEYVISTFGKVDFGAFGSKKFAKFIDKRPEFIRTGTTVRLSSEQSAVRVPENINVSEGFDKITAELFGQAVLAYAKENSPKGGNLGQLNNLLLDKYGKNYAADLGFPDFTAALSSVEGVYIEKNFVYLSPAETEKTVVESSDTAEEISSAHTKKRGRKPKSEEEEVKLDYNTVKRDILSTVASSDGGISLPTLGKLFTEKYGKGYLKEIGAKSMKNLLSDINGISVSDNSAVINQEFLRRTDDIETFVRKFAHESEKRSVRMLSTQIKKNFPEFDFSDYGYARFSDFINAIDGVRANGYYIEPED